MTGIGAQADHASELAAAGPVVLARYRHGVIGETARTVHVVPLTTGVVLLPPTSTPRGPITWTHTPQADSLRRCREIDLFGALRTALA